MRCTECNKPVRPVVALDIDGVLGQYHEHLLAFFDNYFGREMPRGWHGQGNWEDYLGLPYAGYSEGKLAFRQGGLKRWMPAFSGAAELAEEMHALGAEVWITTTRPHLRLDSVDPDTREWLSRNNIYYDHLMYDDDKYTRLSSIVGFERVAAVIEDLPKHYCIAGANFGWDRAVLMAGEHNYAWRGDNPGMFYHSPPTDLYRAAQTMRGMISEWEKEHGAS